MRFILLLIWIGLTVFFLVSSPATPLEGTVRERTLVTAAQLDTSPPRSSLVDPPMVHIGGVDQKCSDCHAIFESLDVTPSSIRQHEHIEMRHGMNGRCFNCHLKGDRNMLIRSDGAMVGYADSTQLCAGCHGTLFRDWERGMHGRTMGSWIRGSAEQWRLRCVDCHDPHAPAFGQIEALPAPNTLRMGEPRHHDGGAQARNPLERWKSTPAHDDEQLIPPDASSEKH